MGRTPIKLIIFDVDGTLYRSESYEEHLLTRMIETLSEMLAVPYEEAAWMLAAKKKLTKTVSGAVEMLGLDRSEFYRRLAKKVEVERYVSPNPKLVEFLKSLRRRGLRVALHTNSGRDLACKVLNALGVERSAYDLLLTSDDTRPKPSPEGYLSILQYFGVDAEDAIYVGDRYEVELKPAKNLGMRTALVGAVSGVYETDYRLASIFDLAHLLE